MAPFSVVAGRTPLAARLRSWELWTIRPAGRWLLLTTELFAGVLLVLALAGLAPDTTDGLRCGLLIALGIGYAELAGRIERLRRFLNNDLLWSDRESAWTFAAALSLPAGYIGLVVITLYGAGLIRSAKHQSVRPYRHIYTTATVLVAALFVSWLVQVQPGLHAQLSSPRAAAIVVAALAGYTGIGLVLTLIAARLSGTAPSLSAAVPDGSQFAIEIVTLGLGAVAAVIITVTPWLSPLLLVLAAAAHRSSLVCQLQQHARQDTKTSLLNWSAWYQLATDQLDQAGRSRSQAVVLMLDLDNFKAVNDEHGHPTGDAVLRAVGECLRRELRGHDALARYGGEEFLALLCDTTLADGRAIAERIRVQVAGLSVEAARVTVSIGLAGYPSHGHDADALVAAADRAMYQAKSAGRDRTVTA